MKTHYASGGYIPRDGGNGLQHFNYSGVDLYAAAALCQDPLAENWRWQKAGFAAKVETRKIALRGAP